MLNKTIKISKYLDRLGLYKTSDDYFRYILAQVSNNGVSKDDFVKMINDALYQGTDQSPDTQMSQYKATNTPGSPNFNIKKYKAKSREIMESVVADSPFFSRFNSEQKSLILNYLDSFAQDPDSPHNDTPDNKKLNDLLNNFGYNTANHADIPQQGSDKLDKAIWLAKLAKQVGFDKGAAIIAVAIVFPESDADPNNVSDVSLETECWGPSVGLWQTRTIKVLGCEGPNDNFRYDPDHKLFDPLNSAEAAYKESRGGRYWKPWSTYNDGKYLAYLDVATTAVSQVYN